MSEKKELSTLPQPQWICSDQALADVCALWQNEAFLAVDTEFVRTTTFYPKAGLIQVASSQGCYLIDPLQIEQWQPLADIFQHPLVVKVFHACAEDLEVCRRLTNVVPAPLADSQLGAALAGFGSSMGFQRVVKALLNIDLAKEETRSNWLERPLREEQIQYAVADVFYLYQLYPKLLKKLRQQDRESWLAQDCQAIVEQACAPEMPALHYQKVKLAWKLRPQEQFVLQQLVVWREQQARSRDVPRNKVVDDSVLWNMARFKVRSKEQLIKAGLAPAKTREDGKALLQIVQQALAIDKQYWPRQLERPLSPQAGVWLKALKKTVAEQAEELGFTGDLLVKKKVLEALLRSGYPRGPFTLPPGLSGWRQQQIGDVLLSQLEAMAAETA